MAMQCDLCGKTVNFGRQLTYRGKAKYLGGVGRKITGINPRKFRPNLQPHKCVVEGVVKTRQVCTQCVRSGRVVKPQKVKPFSVQQ
jgi:large subunit ribosomal protein L28